MTTLQLQPRATIVCEGDSATSRRAGPTKDTWAYLRLMNWHRTWADHLAEVLFCWFPQLHLRCVNNAVGGSTVRGVVSRLETVRALKPTWVLISAGGNDARVGVPLDEYRTSWHAYAEALHREHDTQIVWYGLWAFPTDHPPGKVKAIVDPYWQVLKELSDELPYVHFCDLSVPLTEQAMALKEQWSEHTIYTGADNHFNEVGASMIAGEVLRTFGLVNAVPTEAS